MAVMATIAVPHPPIILPEVGHGEEDKIQKTVLAYREVMRRVAELEPETIIIISPHATMYQDYIHISPGDAAMGDMRSFHAPQVRFQVRYDMEFVKELSQLAEKNHVAAGTMGDRERTLDHGTMIPLYFLNQVYTKYVIVRIGLSDLSSLEHYKLGQCITEVADRLNRRVIVIASGDLSHKLKEDGPYGFVKEGPLFDKLITDIFASGDFSDLLSISPQLSAAAAECGLRSFQIMAGVLDGKEIQPELLSYEGTFGVGYGVAYYAISGLDIAKQFARKYEEDMKRMMDEKKMTEDKYVQLARYSLESYIKTSKEASMPEELPEDMLYNRAGVFVSLKKDGRLRGCIGTIAATTDNIAREIMQNAISAAVNDPRFPAITEDELPQIVYSVDVLGEAEAIDSPSALDVTRFGVIVQKGNKRGLLLPNLEGVNTIKEQIAISKQKAGIGEHEKVQLYRFEVVRHI